MTEGNKLILIADYGRSGQGWLSYMLCYILNAKYIEPYCLLRGIIYTGHQYVIDLTQGNLYGREKTKYSMVVKTHNLPDPFFSLTDKLILLARDPRDVAVSALARYNVRQKTGTDVEKGAQEMAIIGTNDCQVREGMKQSSKKSFMREMDWIAKLKNWLWARKFFCFFMVAYRWGRFYESWGKIDISINVTYEDLSFHTRDTLFKILQYLGIEANDDLVEEAIQKFSFATITGREKGDEERDNVAFRKGIVGGYKEHFNSFYKLLFKILCGKVAMKWGYDL